MKKHAAFIAAALALGACSEETREDTRDAAGSAAEDIEEGTEKAGEEIGEGLENLGERMQGETPPEREEPR